MPDSLLTINQAAERLNVTHGCVRAWVRDGRLPAVRVGTRALRVRPEDLDRVVTPLPTN